MRIEIFALCDAATADFGKLSMLGVFDTIWVTKTPAIHPQCAIALRTRFERIEIGEHRVAVNNRHACYHRRNSRRAKNLRVAHKHSHRRCRGNSSLQRRLEGNRLGYHVGRLARKMVLGTLF